MSAESDVQSGWDVFVFRAIMSFVLTQVCLLVTAGGSNANQVALYC